MNTELYKIRQYVVLVGLGRLQLGLIAPAFTKMGYEVIGVSLNNNEIVARLQKHSGYKITYNEDDRQGIEVRVAEAYFYNRKSNRKALARAAKAKVVNFAMGQDDSAICSAASFLLDLEEYRREHGIVDMLFVTCSDNPVGQEFGIDRIRKELFVLLEKTDDDKRRKLFNDMSYHVRFIRTLADKICTYRDIPSRTIEPVRILAEEYGSIIFDNAFVGMQPLLLDTQKALEVNTSSNIDLERQKKFYTISMAHSMAAYLGLFVPAKFSYVVESVKVKDINLSVRLALEDVAEAFAIKSGQPISDWKAYSLNVFKRLQNEEIKDELGRVARDVRRKLRPDDRLFGPLILVYETLFRINQPLVNTIALALLYAEKYGDEFPHYENDPGTESLSNYLKENGVRSFLDSMFSPPSRYRYVIPLLDAIEDRYLKFKKKLDRTEDISQQD